jgi:hypothetical protein
LWLIFDERDAVRVLAGHGAEHAQGGCHRVAAPLDRQLDDVPGVEVLGVGREGSGAGVLDALVDRQDRDVAGAGEAAGAIYALQVDEHLRLAIREAPGAVDVVGTGQDELLLADAPAGMVQKALRLVAEEPDDPLESTASNAFGYGCHRRSPSLEGAF